MVELKSDIRCCGILELDRVSETTPEDAIEVVAQDFEDSGETPYLFFSDVHGNKGREESGWALAKYITKHKLGTVKSVSPAKGIKNPNSGNMLFMWVWMPNYKKLSKMAPCSKCGRSGTN